MDQFWDVSVPLPKFIVNSSAKEKKTDTQPRSSEKEKAGKDLSA